MKNVAIIGYGFVGKKIHSLFKDAIYYDINPALKGNSAAIDDINKCEISIVCVDTPMKENGEANISNVEKVIGWLETPVILIKSTVPPGTTKRLKEKYGKRIVFSPEYVGETADHPMSDLKNRTFWIFGGNAEDTNHVISIWKENVTGTTKFYQTDETTAEMCKYMGNCFLATKVSFCNEFNEIAKIFGVDYTELRGLFLEDPRVNRDHTHVSEEGGFSGKCLPKDLNAIIAASKSKGYNPMLLEEVWKSNKRFRKDV